MTDGARDESADGTLAMRAAEGRTAKFLRHHLRVTARRIVGDCELLLGETQRPRRRRWREAAGEGLLAGHQLRVVIERWLLSRDVTLSRNDIGALHAELREPQERIVKAMTTMLSLLPAGIDEEILQGHARAIRDTALFLSSDETVAIPVVRDDDRRKPAPGSPDWRRVGGSAAEPAKARLLVVDDADAPRRMLVRLLERLGYDVIAATHGGEALTAIAQHHIDLIISDIEMPVCDGFELLTRLKADEATRDIPIIMVSGRDDLSSVVQCIEQGAEDHIAKPFDGVLLQARVRASLEQKRLRDQELTYLRRVARLTLAAQAVENETYEPGSLEEIANQDDELGRLARVFDHLVSGIRSKEAQMERQLTDLKREVRQSGSRLTPLVSEADVTALVMHHVLADRYEILEELGRGGMGLVYRAHDRELGEEIAVKVVRADVLASDQSLIDRLRTEIRLARRITHPNVVRVFDLGEHEGLYFLTMEFVRGITLRTLLDTRGRLTTASTLAVGLQLADALAVAHEQQIIHRDIKPANLLVDEEGVLKVMDFGLARLLESSARLTMHGVLVGTPRYMAPEQLLDGGVDARSDLYAMGVVLYECLTGLPPFEATSPIATVSRMLDGPPTPIANLVTGVAPAFVALIEGLLRYEPSERPQSAREAAERLRAIT